MAISAFLHCDLSSIIYVGLLFRLMRIQQVPFGKWEGRCLCTLVSLVILLQYGSLLLVSPVSPIEVFTGLKHEWRQYILLELETKWALLIDFLVLIQLFALMG